MLGTMYWPPNAEGARWFAERVLPLLRRQSPEAVFTVIGKRPPGDLVRLAAASGGAIELMGYIDDPRPLLEQTAVFVVPLLSGGGMRVKILDAWAWGLPVVSTSLGAEGIDARPGRDLVIADAPTAFADSVGALMADPRRRSDLGAAGRQAVEERYDARVVYRALDGVYEPVLGATETRP
jgi:glycosyltransferase involved in cell wall biosynthesis